MGVNEQKIKKNSLQGADLRQYGMMIALIVIFVMFSIATQGKLFYPDNFNNLIMQNSYIVILACGMLLCILTGNVDLSVGSVVAFVGSVSAVVMVDYKMPAWVAIIAGLAIGALVGCFQGFFIAFMQIPAFIVTLADMLIFRGLTMVVLTGRTVGPFSDALYNKIANAYLPTYFVRFGTSTVEFDMISLIVGITAAVLVIIMEIRNRSIKRKYSFFVTPAIQSIVKIAVIIIVANIFTYKLARSSGLPIILLILVLIIVIYSFITQNTVAGRHIYALGGNAKAAMLSGINTTKVMFFVYFSMGIMCAVAGIVLSSRNGAATPKAGDSFELDAIAACYIGGASTTGGVGTVIGAVVGALIMGVLNMGMSLLGVPVEWQKVIKGTVLLGAVSVDLISKRRSGN